ncbi:RTEL1 [Mytilus coruscus]|uniref:RTEL1 n=1 Tax=Mytilus coruscus TaxID=42192 RepID=A0A6J8BNE2_MYTCO|nr:RTEL1 [Mytilus coruscus]
MLMTRCAMDRQIPETLTEAVFVDVFKSFARMCGLFPVCGSEWRTKINILKCRVSSEADVILMNADYLKNRTSIMSIVSIVERTRLKRKTSNDSSSSSVTQEEPVNEEPEIFKRIEHAVLAQHGGELFVNAHGNMQCSFLNRSKNSRLFPGMIVIGTERTRLKRKTSNDSSSSSVTQEEPVNEEPEIFKRIEHTVLAQHGGELFVNAHGNMQCSFLNRSKNSRLFPGMIVIGTEVTITVLDYKLDHEIEIHKSNKSITERSCIYYSDTKDLLKKEDRDMVLEALVRMNNRCTP